MKIYTSKKFLLDFLKYYNDIQFLRSIQTYGKRNYISSIVIFSAERQIADVYPENISHFEYLFVHPNFKKSISASTSNDSQYSKSLRKIII